MADQSESRSCGRTEVAAVSGAEIKAYAQPEGAPSSGD
jgi:hypothetical protein